MFQRGSCSICKLNSITNSRKHFVQKFRLRWTFWSISKNIPLKLDHFNSIKVSHPVQLVGVFRSSIHSVFFIPPPPGSQRGGIGKNAPCCGGLFGPVVKIDTPAVGAEALNIFGFYTPG